MKLLILILDLKKEPYNSIRENGINKTWLTQKHPFINTYFYYGDCESDGIFGNEIHTMCCEDYYNIGYKTIRAFEIINENLDYDFVFRTNSSSYVDYDLLYNKLLEIKNDDLYAGVKGCHGDINFASGAGYFISKKNVEYVICNKNVWNHDLIDDVALGQILGDNITILDRVDYINIDINFINTYHYRCKSGSDKRIDNLIMNEIFKYKNNKNI